MECRLLHEMLLYSCPIKRFEGWEERDFPLRVQFCKWLERLKILRIKFYLPKWPTTGIEFSISTTTDENPRPTIQKGHQQTVFPHILSLSLETI